MTSPRRTRTTAIIGTVIAVLIMIVVADRVAPVIIGREIGATLQGALHTSERPQVRIGGFPFLTQVATSRYESVRMTADEVPMPSAGGRLTLQRVEARMSEVDTSDGYRRLVIGAFEMSATVGYPELSELIGRPVGWAGDGRVSIEMPLSVMVTGRPTIDSEGRFQLADAEFTLDGRTLPAQLAERMPELPRTPMPTVGGIEFTDLAATRDGVTLSGQGENLRLTR